MGGVTMKGSTVYTDEIWKLLSVSTLKTEVM